MIIIIINIVVVILPKIMIYVGNIALVYAIC